MPADSKQLTDEQLTALPHAEIYNMREGITDQKEQNRVANKEHRAFARELVTEQPYQAVGVAVGTVARTAAKAVSLEGGRSEASVDQMVDGLKGVGEGLAANSELVKMGRAASFFGQEFGAVAKEVKQEVTQKLSKAAEFFGMDFGSPQPSEPPVASRKQLPEPSKLNSVEALFPKLIQTESKGIHMDASGKLTTSKAGAQGITQLMPKTAKNPGFGIKGVADQSEKEYLRVGKEYLGALHKKFDGDMEKVLAAYNWGFGRVQKAVGVAERFGGDWKKDLPAETKSYLKKILKEEKDA